MKNRITFLFLVASSFAFAQSTIDKADKLFNRMWYKEASVLYETELGKIERKNKGFRGDYGGSGA